MSNREPRICPKCGQATLVEVRQSWAGDEIIVIFYKCSECGFEDTDYLD